MSRNWPFTIYSVFVRNHGKAGTFAEVTADLDRISGLGVDAVWLMPVHPVGAVARKGSLGSPYAISDYRAVNPEFGTDADFDALIAAAHKQNVRVMIDVVFNHTSPDSVLATEHPEWFYRGEDGKPVNRVPDWSDVVDLDHSRPGLADYLVESLVDWVRRGVDGFRCDVASLVPVEFWQQARAACAAVNPDTVWLAETVHPEFVNELRRRGFQCHSDAEILSVFDFSYQYDVWEQWRELVALGDHASAPDALPAFTERLRMQQATFAEGQYKLRFVENHDQPRAAAVIPDPVRLRAWTAFSLFQDGGALVYAGQEQGSAAQPSLFDRDPVQWGADPAMESWMAGLISLRKDSILREGYFHLHDPRGGVLVCSWEARDVGSEHPTRVLLGLFPVSGAGTVEVAELYPGWEAAADPTRWTLREPYGDASGSPVSGGTVAVTDQVLILDIS